MSILTSLTDPSQENTVAANPAEEKTESISQEKSPGAVNPEKDALFAGILMAHDPASYTFDEQQDLDYKGDTYTVARLPFITISSFDDENSIILGFYDKFGGDFYFYGTYYINGGTLTFSPGGSAGSFKKDCAPITEKLTYNMNVANGLIQLNYDKYTVKLGGISEETGILILKGSLTEGSESYKGLQSLDLALDLETEELKNGVLALEGGKTATIDSVSHFPSIHSISLRWSSVDYVLNGREVTENVNGYLSFTYISQYPAGFLAIDSDRTIHYYQDLSDF